MDDLSQWVDWPVSWSFSAPYLADYLNSYCIQLPSWTLFLLQRYKYPNVSLINWHQNVGHPCSCGCSSVSHVWDICPTGLHLHSWLDSVIIAPFITWITSSFVFWWRFYSWVSLLSLKPIAAEPHLLMSPPVVIYGLREQMKIKGSLLQNIHHWHAEVFDKLCMNETWW